MMELNQILDLAIVQWAKDYDETILAITDDWLLTQIKSDYDLWHICCPEKITCGLDIIDYSNWMNNKMNCHGCGARPPANLRASYRLLSLAV